MLYQELRYPSAVGRALMTGVAVISIMACADRSTGLAPAGLGGKETLVAAQGVLAKTSVVVETPSGPYRGECVHGVPNRARIDKHGVVTRADGSTYRIPSCTPPGRVEDPYIGHSWVEWTAYDPGTNWGEIVADWIVPPAPTAAYGQVNDSNQVLYTFPGIETSALTTIIQPVLQFGNNNQFGGQYWTAAPWYCSPTDCYHGDTVLTVSVGDHMAGLIQANSCAGGDCDWHILITDLTTGGSSALTQEDVSSYPYAVGGSIEVYHFNQCQLYPQGGVSFTSIALYDQSSHQASPVWAPQTTLGLSPTCDYLPSSQGASTTTLYVDGGPTVTTAGPTEGNPGQLVTVTATASSGDPPYSYTWTIVNGSGSCGNSSSCSAHLSSTGGSTTTFEVTVKDFQSVTAFAEHQVNVCANGASVVAVSGRGVAAPLGPPPPKC
jgi:hypothetical protein